MYLFLHVDVIDGRKFLSGFFSICMELIYHREKRDYPFNEKCA